MTSLAKQLQRLAVPHAQVILGEDKKKASLLFDPKEAASIDRETFHALGLNGLEELETLDQDFSEFETSLFGDSSLLFERSVQTKKVNAKIDDTIRRFLVHVSPYCLLKPAHKALEWLIYRFHIHFYNTDDLLLCFLPYHETKIFARVLQLIKFDAKIASKWDFLEPLQKNGVHLSRTTLVNHCRTDPAFLSFVCDMVPTAVKVYTEKGDTPKCRVLFSFYATTVIGVLETGQVTEVILSTLLPHISKGMKSEVTEYKAASYMILAQILHKAKLKQDLIKTLQQILAKSMVTDLLGEAVSCMLLLFQTQDVGMLGVTKKTFRHMCHHYTAVDVIARLHSQFDAAQFLSHFLDRLIPAAFKHAVGIATSGESSASESHGGVQEYMSMLYRLLSSVNLPDETAEDAAYKFLSVYIKHGNKHLDNDVDDRIKDSLQGIVRQLEGKHSAAVDRAVSRTLKECKGTHEKSLVNEFLNLYVLSVPHQLVTDSETSLVLSLNHRLPAVREKAVTMLVEKRNVLEEESFLKDSLMLRLKDENPCVVQAALSIGQDLWSVIGDDQQTVKLLQTPVLKGLNNSHWENSACVAAKILGSYSGSQDVEMFTSCLPCLFLTHESKSAAEIIGLLLNSDLTVRHPVLIRIREEWIRVSGSLKESNIDFGLLSTSIARCLAEGLLHDVTNNQLQVVKDWCELAGKAKQARVACLMLVVLDTLVCMVTDSKQRLEVCLLQTKLVDDLQRTEMVKPHGVTLTDFEKDWKEIITCKNKKVRKQDRVPMLLCLKALAGVADVIKVPAKLIKAPVWQFQGDNSESDMFLIASVTMFRLLLAGMSSKDTEGQVYRMLLHSFHKACFSDTKVYLRFLCLLWTQHANDRASDLGLTLTLQARALHLGLAFIKCFEEEDKKLLLLPTVVSSILIVLTSEQDQIRCAGNQYVQELFSVAKANSSEFSSFLKKVVRCAEEIKCDARYINEVIASYFKNAKLEVTSPKKSPRGKSPKKKLSDVTETTDEKQSALKALLELIVNQNTPGYMQYKMLHMFSQLNNKDVLESLLPLMEELLKLPMETLPDVSRKCLNLVMERFTLDTSECLTKAAKGLQLFTRTLQLHQEVKKESLTSQMVAISQVTKELFSSLEDECQHEILGTLFDVCVDTQHLVVANLIRKTLKHLSVNGVHIEKELSKCLKQTAVTTVREAKRMKKADPTPETAGADEFDTRTWQRVTVVLEAVQNKKKIHNYTSLVPVCFNILANILESDNHVSVEYLKQLILTLLYNICNRLDKLDEGDIIPEQQFNMDLIINCIRSSDNPQTHNHALLLLTAAAKIYPEHLLHNMMSVFTFMGANIMRQDDAYSFLIISKILETVIPALITACEQRKRVPKGITNDPDDIITMVIQVFVDSYPYIPEHRRQLLFNKLLKVTGVERYLWRTLLLMMKHVVTKGTLRAELTTDSQEVSGDTEFCLTMCAEFTSSVQLLSAREMIQYLIKLPDDKDDDAAKTVKKKQVPQSFGKLHKDDALIFNVALHTGKQLRYFKYAAINLLVNLFSSTDFLYQISESGEDLSQHFQQVLETALKFVSHVTGVANKSVSKPTAKYWKALLHKTHDMLDKFVSLLPEALFITVIGGLLSHDLPTIQRKAMDLLNSKLQQKSLGEAEVKAMLPVVDQLRVLVRNLALCETITEDGSVNCQAAFISLKLLCRHIGSSHRDVFIQVFKTAVDVFKHSSTSLQVSSCALLCIAEVVTTLRVHVIQQLPTFMPLLIAVMADRDKLYMNELFLMSVVTTVNKVVENLPNFLSPYLHDILTNICVLSSDAAESDILQKPQVNMRLKTIRSTLSTSIPTRVLLPVVTTCYTGLVKSNLVSVSSLMSLFGDHVSHITREDLTSHLTQLQTFFLQCLDIRIDYPQLPQDKLDELEGVTIETIINMVMKLSESTFKPFLFKIFDWATNSDEYRERILVFYKLAERLAERLRSLFTLFAGHIITHAAKMLDENNSIKQERKFFPADKSKYKRSCQLLEYILDCIGKCCLYDTEGFINKERFDLLMQPLVDQLENEYGGEDIYEKRVNEHLVPCIVQLCVAAQDDSLWRALNYQVCLKTRSQDSAVKLAALVTLDGLHKKLGEDYMPLLPDTIPFLAELMEDDSEDVEKKCHAVIREMEKTLGEPLKKYF